MDQNLVQVTSSPGLRCQLGQEFQRLAVAHMCQAGLLSMGGQVVNFDVVISNSCIYMFITTIFQQMADKCLGEEALFSCSHRNPGAKSLDLAGRKDEEESRVRTLLN